MTEAEYPGDEATQQRGRRRLQRPVHRRTWASTTTTSIYDYSFYYPTQETWDDPVLQDREILCLAFADDDSADHRHRQGLNK